MSIKENRRRNTNPTEHASKLLLPVCSPPMHVRCFNLVGRGWLEADSFVCLQSMLRR